MEFEAAEDAIMCRAFPLILREVSRAWFTSLRLRTIKSFKQLEDAFAAQLLEAQSVKKPPSHLFLIVQRERESLKLYV